MHRWLRGFTTVAALGLSVAANGIGYVYLVAGGPLALDAGTFLAVEGATYDVEIWMDFSTDATLGGGYDVVFNEAAFDFVSWTSGGVGDPQFERFPDVLTGLLEGAGVADFSGIGGPEMMAIATFTLTDIAALGSLLPLTTAATSGDAGPWQSAVLFICCQDVEYSGLEFAVVPLPTASWLLAGGLLTLAGLRRRRRLAPG